MRFPRRFVEEHGLGGPVELVPLREQAGADEDDVAGPDLGLLLFQRAFEFGARDRVADGERPSLVAHDIDQHAAPDEARLDVLDTELRGAARLTAADRRLGDAVVELVAVPRVREGVPLSGALERHVDHAGRDALFLGALR